MVIVYYYIRDFFGFVGDVLKFIFDFIMSLVGVLAASASWLISVITSLPALFVIPLTALVIISILYKVLGRETKS